MQSWDNFTLESYLSFTLAWLQEAQRILKSTGSMWIFGTYHNNGIINLVCQIRKIEIINEVVWYKRNAFPNLSGRRLTASHETILWCNKGGKKRKYYFNYEYSKNGIFDSDGLKAYGLSLIHIWLCRFRHACNGFYKALSAMICALDLYRHSTRLVLLPKRTDFVFCPSDFSIKPSSASAFNSPRCEMENTSPCSSHSRLTVLCAISLLR